MSQGAKTIADGSGLAVLAAINAANARFGTMASGTARPSDIGTGELWRETDNPGSGIHSVWLYDGASDVLVGLLNTTAHTWTAPDATRVYVQTFTGSGTYTPHAGMVNCIIELVGGGGGGGGTASGAASTGAAGTGGGAGGRSKHLATAADIGASKAVTIGAAGTGGTAGNNAGGAGGDTSVGTLCVGKGGAGGVGSSGAAAQALAPGAGGVAGTGNILNSAGAPGFGGPSLFQIYPIMWAGGSSQPFGAGGSQTSTLTTATGSAATGFGGGGGGGGSYNGSAAAAGGVGTAGKVVIIEFCSQ